MLFCCLCEQVLDFQDLFALVARQFKRFCFPYLVVIGFRDVLFSVFIDGSSREVVCGIASSIVRCTLYVAHVVSYC